MQLTPDFNPGGARWCDRHEKMECTKRGHGEKPCHKPAIRGTNHCNMHGGRTVEKAKAQGEVEITAWKAVADGNVPTIDPAMAVLGILQMSWLRLQTYGEMLRRQVLEDVETHKEIAAIPDPDDPSVFDLDFDPAGAVQIAPGTGGLIGYTMGAAGKDGVLYRQGEAVRAMVTLEAAERDRVIKYAKIAHDMGISTRLTDLAERWGDVVASRVSAVLEGLALTPEQQALVPDLLHEHLSDIDIGASEPQP